VVTCFCGFGLVFGLDAVEGDICNKNGGFFGIWVSYWVIWLAWFGL
jgi:hypothetical protein